MKLILLLIAPFFLVSCSQQLQVYETPNIEQPQGYSYCSQFNVRKNLLPTYPTARKFFRYIQPITVSDISFVSQEIYNDANAFAFDLANLLAEQNKDENLVFSPYSVWLPLAALANTGNFFVGSNVADINTAAHRALYGLTQSNTLYIANAIFVDERFELQRSFIEAFANYFGAIAYNADFLNNPSETVRKINQWAYDNTNGRIPTILNEISPDTISVILNAIYFNDDWSVPFDPTQNTERTFYGTQGDQNVVFMNTHRNMPFFENEHIQVVRLYYENGAGIYIILPLQQSATQFLSNFTQHQFNEISSNLSSKQGTLMLPRFNVESELPLMGILKTMGLDRYVPNLVYDSPNPTEIGDVLQKALIEVDEEGTVAVAVTAFPIRAVWHIEIETFEMIVDRPFVFVLYGEHADNDRQILFMGMVNEVEQ